MNRSERLIKIVEKTKCKECGGKGEKECICGTCNGSGEGKTDGSKCPDCKTGTVSKECSKCKGED